jgi:putative oxidoreductase
VQRLFSTFPNGWPGNALLLLRLVAATPLLAHSIDFLTGFARAPVHAVDLFGLFSGVCLALGFCTPAGALLQAALEAWFALQSKILFGNHLILAMIGISLSMLGPGAWSIDARLFGRRLIELGRET